MKEIVIPVKAFGEAKSRLAPHLSASARAGLAEAMCADFFETVAGVRCVDRVLVISNEARALDWARRNGWEALAETCQISESVSVDTACAHCAKSGVQALLRIPTDIPLVCRDDIEEVFAALLDRPGCVIVPSRDGTGTNALLRSPPALFPSSFGKDSFARHLASAGAVGVAAKILRNDRIEFDVDEADDLELLRREVPANSRVGRWFSERDRVPPAGSGRGPFPQARQA